MMIIRPLDIALNHLLRDSEKSITPSQMMDLKRVASLGARTGEGYTTIPNLAAIYADDLHRVYDRHGGAGLFQLLILAQTQSAEDFKYIWAAARDQLVIRKILEENALGTFFPEPPALVWDDLPVRVHTKIDTFNHNVINSRLSRQLYHPGVKPGYLVHGVGGPRVLVSHPFRGVSRVSYDIYRNSVDVVTSLNHRGWYGSFIFLDRIEGLEEEIDGIPKWAIWFSQIAAHSDTVIFVKQHMGEFGPSQLLEMAMTPKRVHRKIVEVPAAELSWAKITDDFTEIINLGSDGNTLSDDNFNRLISTQTHAHHFLPLYCEGKFPRDRLIHINEKGGVSEFRQSYTGYR